MSPRSLSSTSNHSHTSPSISSLRIETLTTGDELLSGEWLDQHHRHIARVITELGSRVVRFNSVGDDLKELTEVITEMSLRADCCIMTGGLGPTLDDLTLDALSKVSGASLKISEPLWSEILTRYPQLSLAQAGNRRQARVLEGGEVLHNPVGTAPGVRIKINRCVFFALPGVPHEAHTLIEREVIPWFTHQLGGMVSSYQKVIRVALIGESVIADRVVNLGLDPEIKIGYQALGSEHRIKISAPTPKLLEVATEQIRQVADDAYLNDRDLSLAEQVIETAKSKGLTLGGAESCTGGQFSAALTQVAGASAVFEGSVTSYSGGVKHQLLGVSETTLNECGVFSEECAREMAIGARQVLGVDWAVAITGVAGPGGGSDENPVGTVYFAWADAQEVRVKRQHFRGDRARIQSHAVAYALFKLLQLITLDPHQDQTEEES